MCVNRDDWKWDFSFWFNLHSQQADSSAPFKYLQLLAFQFSCVAQLASNIRNGSELSSFEALQYNQYKPLLKLKEV